MTTRSRLLAVLSAGLCVCVGVALSAQGADSLVAPGGSDENPGTEEKPFAAFAKARDAVRAFKRDASGARTETQWSGVLTAKTASTDRGKTRSKLVVTKPSTGPALRIALVRIYDRALRTSEAVGNCRALRKDKR